MRWFLRAVMLIAVAVIIAGLVRHEWLLHRKPAVEQEIDGNPQTEIAKNGNHDGDLALQAHADDAGKAPPANLKNPITKGLAQIIGGQGAVFGEAADDLNDNLTQADELLYRAKQTNKNAIREAGRQMRIRHQNNDSPDIVLVAVNGLNKNDLGCFGGDESTAAFDAVAMMGARQTLQGRDSGVAQSALIYGAATEDNARNLLLPALWQGGYSTAVIGDCSWWMADQTRDIDFWFGHKTSAAALNPFPESVWAGGKEVTLTGNANGQQGVAAHALFASEAVDFVARYRERLPYFLAVSLDVRTEAFPRGWTKPETVAVANQHLAEIEAAIIKRGWKNNTLLVIVGIPQDNADAPLLVRWPRRIAPNLSIVGKGQYNAIPKTLLSLARVQRRPRSLTGETLAKVWRTPVN